MTKPIRLAIGIASLLVAMPLVYLLWAWNHGLDTGGQTYVVQPGTSLHSLSRRLYRDQVLPDPKSLVWLAYLKMDRRHLKVGEYEFKPGITAAELLDQVLSGRVLEYPLALIEGWNFRQVREVLRQAPKLQQGLNGLSDQEVMTRLGHAGVHPEGNFYPDTYYYSATTTDADILHQAFAKMHTALETAWAGRDEGLPYNDPYEALIMASIVEKETGKAEERPLIAGVFINRLRRNMRLQTDPTVIYGLGAKFDGNIRWRDLRTDTPYNTYTRAGLPPTPIAMPSRAALHAALHPAETSALFFVARGDGSHVFTDNLADHNAAVRKYQLGK